VREFLRQLNAEHGTTILLTSHYMADIEELCPRVLVIDGGRLHYDGSLAGLVERTAPHKVLRALFAEPVPAPALQAALGPLAPPPGDDPRQVEVAVPRAQVADVTSGLLRLGQVVDLSVEEAPVEAIVRDLFRDTARTRGTP
jgi:ABC-2 type transport system ATP-binding protein